MPKNTKATKRRMTMAKIIRSNDNKVKVKDIRQGDIFKYDNCYYIKTSLGQVTCSSNSYGNDKVICSCGLIDLETGEYKTLEENTYISKIDAAINIFE